MRIGEFCIGLNYRFGSWELLSTSAHLLCSRHSCNIYIFIHHNNDVTQKKFRFPVLVMCCLRMAVMHLPTKFAQIALYPIRSYWHFPKSKIATAAILDFQFMWIWRYQCVDSAVFVFCTKCGSNICYRHWDRRTSASDLHLMTSRKLTSGLEFGSRGHIRMTVVHLPI